MLRVFIKILSRRPESQSRRQGGLGVLPQRGLRGQPPHFSGVQGAEGPRPKMNIRYSQSALVSSPGLYFLCIFTAFFWHNL